MGILIRIICCAGLFGIFGGSQAGSIEEFAKHPDLLEAVLSPTGEYIALAQPVDDETQLQIISLSGNKQTKAFRFGANQHVTDIEWVDDERVSYERAKKHRGYELPFPTGELYAVNVDGSNPQFLFGDGDRRKDQGSTSVLRVLDKQPGFVLVSFRSWKRGDDAKTVIYKVNTHTGDRERLETVVGAAAFSVDQAGNPRLMMQYNDDDEPEAHYRPTADSEWLKLPSALVGYEIQGARFLDDGNTAFALISDQREPAKLYQVDFKAGTRKLLIGRDNEEISSIGYQGRAGAPYVAIFGSQKPAVEYIDKASARTALHASLMKLFPGELVQVVNASRDDKKILFFVGSDRHPGAYYLYDQVEKKVKAIAETRPGIDPAKMAAMKPISFETSDGLTLHGFYTAHGAGTKPLVVMPHGGPHGPFDSWSFDVDTQFLASLGYGVLQINYRGSGGRGQAFIEKGYLEWGKRIQQDIAEATRWAIAQNFAEPKKICIFGASFGGYSALQNPIAYPDLYRCAIGYVGVYDLNLMHTAGDIKSRDSGRRYLQRVIGKDQSELDRYSPAKNVEKINLPILLVHGAVDTRVPIKHFNALKSAFKKAGRDVETMVVAGEGHGFHKPENRVTLYKRMQKFLAKRLN